MSGMPSVKVLVDAASIAGGMDIVTTPMFAKPGSARLAYNYEYNLNGGVDRIRGIEPFDGQTSPSSATYIYLQCSASITSISLGDTVVGDTSGATGVCIYLSEAFIALTRVTLTFGVEDLKVGGITQATVIDASPSVDGFLENVLLKLAADEYQRDIGKVPGTGAIRGLAILNDVAYAWRDNTATPATACKIYKSTGAGWVEVTFFHSISFTLGTALYAEGSTLTQGAVSATVKRVVTESGAWTGTAAGRLIITAPTGGSGAFVAGAAVGGGACTLSGASALITLLPGGSVSHDAYSFTAAKADKRLYGCDGVNDPFEFDGTVYVPLSTGMGSIKASVALCHKNYLYLAYRGSLQNSAIGDPYVWSAVLGAGEFATGDVITNLKSVGGATDASALMVLCENALFMLYGDSSLNWNMIPLSRVSGAMKRSVVDIGGIYVLDTPGVMFYPPTKSFGNFAWDTCSMAIQPIARNQHSACSVYVSGLFKYRIFFEDGTAISGLPQGPGKIAWSVIDYGRNIIFAEHVEVANIARTFYADDQGWVYEADVGRSFAGDPIEYGIKLQPLSQRSPGVEKTFRQLQLEVAATSACTLYTSGEFGGTDTEGATQVQTLGQPGTGLTWDLSSYDESFWDVSAVARKTVPLEGGGVNVSVLVQGKSDNELTHTLYAVSVLYTPRKLSR